MQRCIEWGSEPGEAPKDSHGLRTALQNQAQYRAVDRHRICTGPIQVPTQMIRADRTATRAVRELPTRCHGTPQGRTESQPRGLSRRLVTRARYGTRNRTVRAATIGHRVSANVVLGDPLMETHRRGCRRATHTRGIDTRSSRPIWPALRCASDAWTGSNPVLRIPSGRHGDVAKAIAMPDTIPSTKMDTIEVTASVEHIPGRTSRSAKCAPPTSSPGGDLADG